jgi:lipoprotein-anchoring transpeptidase ErfK/SrfK
MMRWTWLAVFMLAPRLVACALAQHAAMPTKKQPASSLPVPLFVTAGGVSVPLVPPLPTLDPTETEAAAARLQTELRQHVYDLVRQTPASVPRWITLARAMLAAHDTQIGRAQVLVVVDRNPHVQQLALVVAQPDAPWIVLGGTHVSTGQPNRHGYYITPTGVFLHDGSILDYRAQGTFNENHIRGLGMKGMRVWDFGWQWARKGWLHTSERGQIRLLMHATDPAYLAQRIGRPASEGCVRVPADMNRFMDRRGVLDADYEQVATYDVAYHAILSANAEPTPLAGDKLVVIDSSEE